MQIGRAGKLPAASFGIALERLVAFVDPDVYTVVRLPGKPFRAAFNRAADGLAAIFRMKLLVSSQIPYLCAREKENERERERERERDFDQSLHSLIVLMCVCVCACARSCLQYCTGERTASVEKKKKIPNQGPPDRKFF